MSSSPLPLSRDVPALLEAAIEALQTGRLADARALCNRAVQVQPKHAGALHLLGVLLCQAGEHDKGLKLIRRALAFQPRYPAALNDLGNILKDLGRLDEAMASYDKALGQDPTLTEAWFNSGNALLLLGRPIDAVQRFDRVLSLRPGYAAALVNRGNALGDARRLEEALASFDRAIAAEPRFVPGHYNRANTLAALGRTAAALEGFDRVLKLDPRHVGALDNRGIALQQLGRHAEAAASYERALSIQPDDPETLNNLGNLRHEQGRVADAAALYEQAARLRPHVPGIGSNHLMMLNYMGGRPAEAVLSAHRAWAQRLPAPAPRKVAPRAPGRLRVGYVSADFRIHSVAYFLEPLLEHHDRGRFEVFCYPTILHEDATTERLRCHADHWELIAGLDDAAAAARIAADGIDLLVDLGGHTAQSRLALFAQRPGRVQVSWLGYPNTTGLPAIDYRLTDAIADPPGLTDPFHSERLIRLDGGFLCYRPPADAPDVVPPPCLEQGHVTFGSFNHPAKLGDETVAAWAGVLSDVPGSRLLLKAKIFDDAATATWYRDRFVAAGLAPDRLDLVGYIDARDGHLAAYGRIDVALDPFPYNGTTTTCEALWMGVPVVTLAGERHAGRVGASLLHRVGLDDLVAPDVAGYRTIAAGVADPRRLTELRAGMRARLAASPLLDGASFARSVEAAFDEMNR